MRFYDRFLLLCEEKGKAPTAVASEIGLNNSSTSYWKKGSMPKSRTLEKLAAYFGVSVDFLLGGEDAADPEFSLAQWPALSMDDGYRVTEISVESKGRMRITYSVNDGDLTSEEFQNLVKFFRRLRRQYGVRPSEVEDIVEMAVKTVSKTAQKIRLRTIYEASPDREEPQSTTMDED